ncbi:MAG: hypothetical protein JSS49_08995 [Planctomycetes bacterium]|nr:hypothetical protein [Planctomycetota bacterium]
MSEKPEPLTAWQLGPVDHMTLEPAPADRDWMDRSNNRFAYRCLPLLIANQGGWIIRNPIDFSLSWNGGNELHDLQIHLPEGSTEARISSHFGQGIVTFIVPYLFRTPRGVNLWVKGPANWIKDGIQPLEGIVETDWNDASFTMNWKMTRKDQPVSFERGEPICMIVPIPRGLAENLEPVCEPLHSNPGQLHRYEKWRESRKVFNEGLKQMDAATLERGWQKDYLLGIGTDGHSYPDHQTKLNIRPFRCSE